MFPSTCWLLFVLAIVPLEEEGEEEERGVNEEGTGERWEKSGLKRTTIFVGLPLEGR